MITRTWRHVRWPLGGISNDQRRSTRYSIRLLRYWFARSLLERLHARLGRPLRVLEVGVGGVAELPTFLGSPAWIERWDGFDVNRPHRGAELYSDFISADIEQPLPPTLTRRYDAVVLCHILEHLAAPEAAMARLLEALDADGLMIGGSPTMPAFLAIPCEALLRRKFKSASVTEHRHLSVITPARISRFARGRGLEVELNSGTFFMRWTGSVLENYASWIRANLAWGAAFPSLGGEVYFSLRKPASGR